MKKLNFVHSSLQIKVCVIIDRGGLDHSSVVSVLGSQPLELGLIFFAATLEGSFLLATRAIHLISMVPACLFALIKAKVILNSPFHHPSLQSF